MVNNVKEIHNAKAIYEEATAKEQCHHYWVIEGASGPTSRGLCKFCSAVKEFSNRLPDTRLGGGNTLLFELAENQGTKEEEKEAEEEEAESTRDNG